MEKLVSHQGKRNNKEKGVKGKGGVTLQQSKEEEVKRREVTLQQSKRRSEEERGSYTITRK